MKKIILIFILLFCLSKIEAQTTLYSENFNGTNSTWLLGHIDDGWVINNTYTCSGATGNTPNQGGQGYLHVFNNNHLPLFGGMCDCFYPASGGKTIYTTMVQTVNTIGFDSVTVSFQWICGGNANTYGFFQYSIDGGLTFTNITIPVNHFYSQTTWATYTLTSGQLTALLNQPLLKFRFGFTNGNSGNSPAFGIDNFIVKGYANPIFNLSLVESYNNLCAGNHMGRARVIATGGIPNYSYQWYNNSWTPLAGYIDSLQTALQSGNYWVVAHDAANHWDTVQVTIGNTNPAISVDAGIDKAICLGGNTQLNGTGGIYYNWSPSAGLSSTVIPNPIATPTVNTTYYMAAFSPVGNAIVNGDFSLGNTGFTSDYGYSTSLLNEGLYDVTASPYSTNPGFVWSCTDHTVGGPNDNMMVVNGASLPNVNVWCETLQVIPNTTYSFSTWVMCVHALNPAILQFSINGSLLGTPFSADPTQCLWKNFYELWNSGNNTTATICVVNQNTATSGNDFALDDISFSALCQGNDSVRVAISIPLANAGTDTIVCNANPVTLHASGGVSYSWNTSPIQNSQQIIVNPSSTTTYTVTVTDSINCTATDQVLVNVGNIPVVHLGNDTVLCSGQSLMLSAGSGYNSYLWNNSSTNATLQVNAPGTYWVKATNSCGFAIDTIHVTYAPPLNLNIGNDTVVCQGSTLQLNAGSGFSQYLWNNNSQLPTLNVNQAGTYFVKVTNSNGCSTSDTVQVTFQQINVNLGNDTLLCAQTNLTLHAGNPNASYLWSTGSTQQNLTVNAPGTYWVRVTSSLNCLASDTIHIQYDAPISLSLGNDTALCNGTSLTLNPGSFSSYLWENGSTSAIHSINNSGIYWVRVSDAMACFATDSIHVTFHAPVVDLGPDRDFCSTDNLILDAGSGFALYNWQDGSNSRYYPVLQPGTYYVTAGYPNCVASDTIVITPCQSLIIPNVFTPNNDGINDVFRITGASFNTYDLKIFSRWGNLIFETQNASIGWNGDSKNSKCPDGVYYFTLDYTEKNNPSDQKKVNGSVTLLR